MDVLVSKILRIVERLSTDVSLEVSLTSHCLVEKRYLKISTIEFSALCLYMYVCIVILIFNIIIIIIMFVFSVSDSVLNFYRISSG